MIYLKVLVSESLSEDKPYSLTLFCHRLGLSGRPLVNVISVSNCRPSRRDRGAVYKLLGAQPLPSNAIFKLSPHNHAN